MKEIELEKTYLAKYLPEGLLECKKIEIQDSYFPVNVVHPILRLRKNGNKYQITKTGIITVPGIWSSNSNL